MKQSSSGRIDIACWILEAPVAVPDGSIIHNVYNTASSLQLQRNSCRRQNSEATLFCRYFSLYTKSMVMLCFSLNIQHFFYKFISLFMKMSYVFTLRLCLFMIFHGDFLVLYTSQLNWIMFWSAFSVSFLGLFQVGPFSANMWRRVWISWAQGPNNNCVLFDVLHIKKKIYWKRHLEILIEPLDSFCLPLFSFCMHTLLRTKSLYLSD